MNEYPLGASAYLSVDFQQLGLAINPASLAIHLRTEDRNVAIYTLAGGQIVQGRNNVSDTTATGSFFYVYTTVYPGDVGYTWYSGSQPIAGAQGKLHVSPPLA